MMDLDRELWRLGIPSKTRHNEVAPAQFEMAPCTSPPPSAPTKHDRHEHDAAPRGQARPHVPAHEKPSSGSTARASTTTGRWAPTTVENLLDPGPQPARQRPVLAFLAAIIRAVNVHADLLRAGVADAGNDHRLGANEAPPAIVSVFLGAQLEDVSSSWRRVPPPPPRPAVDGAGRDDPARPARDATTATGPRRSPSPATSSSSARLDRPPRFYWPQTGPKHRRGRLPREARRRARQARTVRLRRPDQDLSGIVKENKQILFEGKQLRRGVDAEAERRRAAQ